MRAAARRALVGARWCSSAPALVAPATETTLPGLRSTITAQRKEIANAADKKAAYWQLTEKATSLEAVVTVYEEMMFPVHELRNSIYNMWVERWGVYSMLVNQKNATEAEKAELKRRHTELGELIEEQQAKQVAYVAETFDTAIYNNVLSSLSANEAAPGAHQTAIQIFHDMTDNGVTFDQETKNMLKKVCFGDSVHENSDLLMSMIEYPERGHHTFVPDEPLEKVSARAMNLVSERHTIEMSSADEVQRDEMFCLRPSGKEEPAAIES